MQLTEPMMLPVDLLLMPIAELPEHVRQQVQADEGDYALTRPNSRTLCVARTQPRARAIPAISMS